MAIFRAVTPPPPPSLREVSHSRAFPLLVPSSQAILDPLVLQMKQTGIIYNSQVFQVLQAMKHTFI